MLTSTKDVNNIKLFGLVQSIDIERPKIDCLSFVMCSLLAQLKIGFFFATAIYSTNEANKAGLKQSIFLDVYGSISFLKADLNIRFYCPILD
jgi:hypothetical protein